MRVVEMAYGLCLDVNALQEVAQRDGNVSQAGLIDKIAAVPEALPVPVVLKEMGFGFSVEVAQRLNPIPVWGIDTGWRWRNGHRAGKTWIFNELCIPAARNI